MQREERTPNEEGIEEFVKEVGRGLIEGLRSKYDIREESIVVDCYGEYVSDIMFKVHVTLPDYGLSDKVIINLENSSVEGDN